MAKQKRKAPEKAKSTRRSAKARVSSNIEELKPTQVEEDFEHVLRRLIIARDRQKSKTV